MANHGTIQSWTTYPFPRGIVQCNDCNPGTAYVGFNMNSVIDANLANLLNTNNAVGKRVVFTVISTPYGPVAAQMGLSGGFAHFAVSPDLAAAAMEATMMRDSLSSDSSPLNILDGLLEPNEDTENSEIAKLSQQIGEAFQRIEILEHKLSQRDSSADDNAEPTKE